MLPIDKGRTKLKQFLSINPLEPSVRYIGQQSYWRLLQPAVSLVVVTSPQMANLAKKNTSSSHFGQIRVIFMEFFRKFASLLTSHNLKSTC